MIEHAAPDDYTTIRKFVVRLTVVRGVKVLAQEAMDEFGIDASRSYGACGEARSI